jgi:hypothetical protein
VGPGTYWKKKLENRRMDEDHDRSIASGMISGLPKMEREYKKTMTKALPQE